MFSEALRDHIMVDEKDLKFYQEKANKANRFAGILSWIVALFLVLYFFNSRPIILILGGLSSIPFSFEVMLALYYQMKIDELRNLPHIVEA